ncbi:MAG: heat-inducible transcriptional repressor HrcA [Chloroflexi bacterium]|nr:heat-inducible transcriptional repressor HrcA [Chloroflexota bacterium]MDA1003500.1 heat-inducible transcriptional repressor HrcA [Chloroflexota bacterium]MQC27851.1 heat-inducible transcription repressor HrcA [Chloroflexota bacterium]
MLTDRQAAILRLVVQEYIETAEPVSSRSLVEKHQLPISSATIRNEMARLEEDGYITHPHTSAGRVPAEIGYRRYVESLMAEDPIAPAEQRTIEHQLHQVLGGLDEWLSLAATILAASVGNVAVVTRPQATGAHLKHMQLVELHGESVLLVAVMDDGRVRQRILPQPTPTRQDVLNERTLRLNARMAGLGGAATQLLATEISDPEDATIVRAVAELIEEQRYTEETFLDGLRAALEQPEFASVDRMLMAVQQLQAYRVRRLVEQARGGRLGITRVLIGREHGVEGMQEWSVVVSSYGDAAGSIGAVAVLGPTRMHYERTIPRVRYVAALMSHLIEGVR